MASRDSVLANDGGRLNENAILPPCPFCGGNANLEELVPGGFQWWACCDGHNCNVCITGPNRQQVIDAWTRRTPSTPE